MAGTVNLTFSIPIELSQELHAYVKKQGASRFVAEAIKKALEEKRNKLKNEYLMANDDEGQREAAEAWSVCGVTRLASHTKDLLALPQNDFSKKGIESKQQGL